MKTQLLTLPALAIATIAQGQTVLVNENFDSFTVGAYLAQSAGAPWTTWSNSPGGSDDVLISNEQAASGTNSALWVSTSVTGGPGDVVIDLGNQTAGVWEISFNMYIPSNFGGYFNILHLFNGQNSEWAAEISFPANGDVSVMLQGTSSVYGSYPHDVWFPVHVTVDLDQMNAVLEVNNAVVYNWPFNWTAGDATLGLNQLGGMDIFAYAGGNDGAKFYIDDMLVQSVVPSGIHETSHGNVQAYPNPVNDILNISTSGGQGQWTMRDAAGRSVLEGTVPGTASNWGIPVGSLPAGAYQLELLQNGRRSVSKVLKQ